MPTEKEIVDQLRGFYEGGGMRQKDLAAALGLSPQQLAEILASRNRPTAAQILRIQEFLKEKTMSSIRVDPPVMRQAASNPGPKTLLEARDRIADLEAQLLQLRGSATAPKAASTVPAPTMKPKLAGSGADAPTIATPGSVQPNKNQMAVNVPAPEKKSLPTTANTPVLVQLILDKTVFGDLLSMLDNPVHSSMQRACIYAEVKKRRALEGV